MIPVENTGRSALLHRVRNAFHHSHHHDPRSRACQSVEAGTVTELADYRRRRPVRQGLVELFVERVEEYDATVHVVAPDEVEQTLARVIGDQEALVPRGFPWAVPTPVHDSWLDATELEEIPVVATTVTLGIATTGTMVLTHGDGQGRPPLTTRPAVHVCVVLEDQVVLGVPDAVAALDPRRPQTWVSGPSTPPPLAGEACEQSHCPQRLEVVLVRGR